MNPVTKCKKLSLWLSDRQSHTAYDVKFLQDRLAKFGISVKWNSKGDVHFGHTKTGRASWRKALRGDDFKKRADRASHPLGPIEANFSDDEAPDLWLLGGWQIASALCEVHGIKPSDSYGRGSAFNENLSKLKESGV